ncbi:MAG: hypothetical protein M3167_05125 [Acidobacteriota bacterium]|nr:hypothetical protein [Acidobacteriota bacterium]
MSTTKIRIVPEPDSTSGGMASGSSALAPRENDAIVLRFRIQADEESFEALRVVRRSMLREESTLGRGEGEPSLADAIFSSDGIVWAVLPGQKQLCFDRIAALEERVARALDGFTGERLTSSSRF